MKKMKNQMEKPIIELQDDAPAYYYDAVTMSEEEKDEFIEKVCRMVKTSYEYKCFVKLYGEPEDIDFSHTIRTVLQILSEDSSLRLSVYIATQKINEHLLRAVTTSY